MSFTKLGQSSKGLLTNSGNVLQLLTKGIPEIRAEVVAHESPVPKQTKPSPFFPATQQLVAIISDFGVLDIFLVGSPEPLNTPGALVFVPHIITPRALNTSGHIMPVPVSHRLQCKELEANYLGPLGESLG